MTTSETTGHSGVLTTRTGKPVSEVFAWDNDRLVILDSDIINLIRRKSLSASTAKSIDSNPARWAFEKALPSHENPFDAAPLGTSAHSVMEDLFALKGKERTQDKAMSILLAHSKEAWPGKDEESFAKRGLWISEVHAAYKGLWDIEDPRQVSVFSREFAADGIEIAGVPFIGYIDRIDITPDGYRVVDYKSSKKMPANITRFGDDHGDQMRLYSEVIRVHPDFGGELPAEAALYYTRLGKSRSVPLSKQKMRETLNKFAKSWKLLNKYLDEAAFPCKPGPLCGWCPLVNVCPVARAHDYVDRTVGPDGSPGAPTRQMLDIPVISPYLGGTKKVAVTVPDFDFDFGSAADDDFGADPADGNDTVPGIVLDDDFGSAAETSVQVPAQVPVEPEVQVDPVLLDPDPAVPVSEPACALPIDDFAEVTVLPARERTDAVPEPVVETFDLPDDVHPDAAFDLPDDFESFPPEPDPDGGAPVPDSPIGEPAPGSADPGAAHMTDETSTTPPSTAGTEKNTMSNLLSEGKPWDETVNGRLNPASYAATAVFGTVTLAYEELHKAGVGISKANIDALATTFAHIVATAQQGVTGVESYQDAANTRLRGALRTVIDANPLPWGGSQADWDQWVDLTTKHVKSIASAALRLYDADLSATPWHTLSVRQANAG
ncbi:RecB family exonuclease [Nocardioides pakistanensis]